MAGEVLLALAQKQSLVTVEDPRLWTSADQERR